MDIAFSTTKLRKIFNSDKELIREFGAEMAKRIRRRLDDLAAQDCLEEMESLPGRFHQHQNTEEFSLDLEHPYRLMLKATEPVPRKPDGGVDRKSVTAITIIGVMDPHGK